MRPAASASLDEAGRERIAGGWDSKEVPLFLERGTFLRGRSDHPRCFLCRLKNKLKKALPRPLQGGEGTRWAPLFTGGVCRPSLHRGASAYLLKGLGRRGRAIPCAVLPLFNAHAVCNFYLHLKYMQPVLQDPKLILSRQSQGQQKTFSEVSGTRSTGLTAISVKVQPYCRLK